MQITYQYYELSYLLHTGTWWLFTVRMDKTAFGSVLMILAE